MVVELQSKLSQVGIQQELTRDNISMRDAEHGKKRFREDYVPACVEDLVQWMSDRQKDLGSNGERESPRCPPFGEGVDRRRPVHGRDINQAFARKVSTWGSPRIPCGRGVPGPVNKRRRTLRKPMSESSDSDAPLLLAREATVTVVPREHGGIPSRSDHVAVVAVDVDDSEGHSREGAHEELLDQFQQDLLRRTAASDQDAPMPCPSRRVALVPEREGGTPRSIQFSPSSERLSVPVTPVPLHNRFAPLAALRPTQRLVLTGGEEFDSRSVQPLVQDPCTMITMQGLRS